MRRWWPLGALVGALALALGWWSARSELVRESSAADGGQPRAGACDCGAAGAAAAPAAPPPAAAGARPLQAARFAVCPREESAATLTSLALLEGRPALWALHCGRSLHLIAIEELSGGLVPLRVAIVESSSPNPAEAVAASEPAAADVDGDGRADLIAPVLLIDRLEAPRGGALFLLRQRAAGGFEPPRRVLGAAPGALAAAALDTQPGADLVLLQREDASTRRPDAIWLLSGGPAPVRFAQRPAGVGVGSLATLDLDLDRRDDIAVTVPGEGRVRLWLSARGPLAEVEPLELALASARQTLVADVDGDGQRDLVIAAEGVAVLFARQAFVPEPRAIAGSEGLRALHVLDVDADGKPDLIGHAHPELFALLRREAGGFERRLVAGLRGEPAVLSARVVQLDRDPRPDLLIVALSARGDDVELAFVANFELGSIVQLADDSRSLPQTALLERFTAQ